MNPTTADDEYASSGTVWDGDDLARLRVSPNQSIDPSASPRNTSSSPLPRSSTDSDPKAPSALWGEGAQLDRRDTLTTIQSADQQNLVEPGFDESVLRALCELDVRSDCAFHFMLRRLQCDPCSAGCRYC